MSKLRADNGYDIHPALEERLVALAAEVFQTDAAAISLEMGPDDIDRWDSLSHLRLITAVESTWSIRLTMPQIQQIETLADIATLVSQGTD